MPCLIRAAFILPFSILFAYVGLSQSIAVAASYICEKAAHYEFTGDGLLTRRTDEWVDSSKRLVFDDATGSLYQEGLDTIHMRVLQHGSAENDVVAAHEMAGPARYVLITLRIRVWEDPIPFFLQDQDWLFSGTCSRLGS